MQNREILIANNRDQSKYKVVTGAETLSELQEAIAANENVFKMVGQTWTKNETPIDVSGLTFTEGITKTQLISENSALPTNVQFRGQVTNNLVILLTNTHKQIRSGAGNRKEAYRLVKELNLQDFIFEGEGKNYTLVKTSILENYINLVHKENDSQEQIAEVREELKDQEKVQEEANTQAPEKKAPHADLVELIYLGIKHLTKTYNLVAEDIDVLAGLTTELSQHLKEEKPEITVSDMDDMLSGLGY